MTRAHLGVAAVACLLLAAQCQAQVRGLAPWSHGGSNSDSNSGSGSGSGSSNFPGWPGWPGHHHHEPPFDPFHPWHPVDPRHLDYFSLLAMLPDAIAQMLCALLGCPNFVVMESSGFSRNSSGVETANTLSFMATTVGPPASLLMYFAESTQFTVNTNDWNQQLAEQLLTGDFSGLVNIKEAAFASGMVVESVIEYFDKNGNGRYDPGNDTVRSTLDLAKERWGPMQPFKHVNVADNVTELQANVTSQDKVVTLEYTVTSKSIKKAGLDTDPGSTKLSVGVNNYPYSVVGQQEGNSRLALRMFIVSASANASVSADINDTVAIGNDGYFSWVINALVDGKSVDVNATIKDATSGTSLSGSILKMIMDVSVIGNDHSMAKEFYFSFDAYNPKSVWWDPTQGYLLPSPNSPSNNPGDGSKLPWVWIGIGIGAATLAAAGGAFWFVRSRRNAGSAAERTKLLV